MNRKERRMAARAGLNRSASALDATDTGPSIADLMSEARRQYQRGHGAHAEGLCRQILARMPTHVDSLNLIGIIAQSSGRTKFSKQMFTRAIASDPMNAACHYNLGSSYQVLKQRDEAVIHLKKAIVLGLSEKNVEDA